MDVADESLIAASLLQTGLVRSDRRRHFRGTAGGPTLERPGRRQLAEERAGVRAVVNHGHEENALHHGERSLHSGEDTARHRARRLEPERRVRQMLVSTTLAINDVS